MAAPHPPTSRDVARAAGVSQATVSYALTGRGTVSARTREHVLQVAESIGYRPNLAARSMRTRRTGRIAVVTGATLDSQLRVLAGAGEVAEAAGFAIEAHPVDGTVQGSTDRVLDLASGGQHEGVLALVPVLSEALAEDVEGRAPVVAEAAFDDSARTVGDLADASLVDVFVGALADAGFRRFLHVAGPEEYASARARRDAYLAAVETRGLTSLGVVGRSWSGEAGRLAVHALPAVARDARPLAVVAANDVLAAGALRGAAERGWTVPGDLVVTGWDDNPVGAFMTPSLTTVAVDFPEAGRRAMRRLVATLRGEPHPEPSTPIHRPVWRESTGEATPAR